MKGFANRYLLVSSILFFALVEKPVHSQPRISFSDIQSGPSSGGEGGAGAFITVVGSGFGDQQGKSAATLSGSPIHRIVQWSAHKIVVQIDSSARSGDIQIAVAGMGTSNLVTFQVAPGSIHFVSRRGDDRNPGSFHAPWASIARAAHAMRPGDITYVMSDVKATGLDNYHAAISIQSAGVASSPMALLVYPEASVTIGDWAGEEFGVRTPAIHGGPFSNWVLAGFTIQGANTALKLVGVSNWRIVNNDFSCPSGDGAAACVEIAASSNINFLGNTVHDAGRVGGSKRYQSVYFTTDSNHIEVGWNRILNNHSCRGIQFHSSPVSTDSGFNQYDLSIHDNVISGQVCDGLNLATVDPSKGRIVIFNNLIHHVGTGPAPSDGESSYACINSPGIVNRGLPGSGTVEIYNNTLADCGGQAGPSAGAISVGARSPELTLKNNLIYQANGEGYITPGTPPEHIHGRNNLWFGNGPAPRQTEHNLNQDPEISVGVDGLTLRSNSPAKHGGYDCGLDHDLAGANRATTGICSIGAFE
jgi:hypothetical protein